jgi:hypothetical protein
VTRLAALLVLTAAFAPAAVMGAMPFVVPVVAVVVGVALVAATLAPEPALEPARTEPAPVTPSEPPR